MPSSLEDIRGRLVGAITEAGRLEITHTMVDSECFREVLEIMNVQTLVFEEMAATAISEPTEQIRRMTITGKSSLLGLSMNLTVLIDDVPTRYCTVTPTLPNFNLSDLGSTLFTGSGIEHIPFHNKPLAGVTVLIDSRERKLRIRASIANEEWVIWTNPRIAIANPQITLERIYNPKLLRANTRLIFEAATVIGNAPNQIGINGTLKASIGRNAAAEPWELQFTGGDDPSRRINFANFAALFGGGALATDRPAGFDVARDVFLREVLVSFRVGATGVSIGLFSITVGIAGSWTVYQGVDVGGLSATLEIARPFNTPSLGLTVQGTVTLQGVEYSILVAKATNSSDWELLMRTANNRLQLSKASALPGGPNFGELAMPSGIDTDATVILDHFLLVLRPSSPVLIKVDLEVSFLTTWDVIPGWLAITNPGFALEIDNPLDRNLRNISGWIGGYVRVPDVVDLKCTLTYSSGRWSFRAETVKPVYLKALVAKLFANAPNAPNVALPDWWTDFPNVTLNSLLLTYTTSGSNLPGEFTFTAEVGVKFEFTFGNRLIEVKSVRGEFRSGPGVVNAGVATRTRSLEIKGTIEVEKQPLEAFFKYATGPGGGWSIGGRYRGFEGVFHRETATPQNARFEISFGNRSLGDLISEIVFMARRMTDPNATEEPYHLPAPWNILETISLQGLVLKVYTSSNSTRLFGMEYRFTTPVDLGFMVVTGVSIFKLRNGRLEFAIEGRVLGAPVSEGWDLNDPNATVPGMPGQAGRIFDLRFLALGQRLAFTGMRDIRTVAGALTGIENAFSNQNPMAVGFPAPPLGFAADGKWLIGADFTILGFLSLALVFNDGVVAGLALRLSGERARNFAGLSFEILYKKVTESVGVYQIELSLPNAFRQIELGQVSLTLPVIALEIYTNGNFRVDLGFPRNGDFSRSFMVQVFPFLGAGGFYFAMLDGDTSNRLPSDYDRSRGVFRPVLEFGVGLSLGIGKSIERGVFSATLSLTFEGIMEGVIAFFNPVSGAAADSAIYFRVQGTFAIVGRLQGSVNLAVIAAAVSVVARASVSVTYETNRPILLTFRAGVDVNVSVRVGVGWLAVNVRHSFREEFVETFELPVRNGFAPPWVSAAPAGLSGSFAPAMLAESNGAPVQAGEPPNWDILLIPPSLKPFRLEFRPGTTVGDLGAGQKAYLVSMLFLNEDTIDFEPAPVPRQISSERLAEGLLHWVLAAWKCRLDDSVTMAAVRAKTISSTEINEIHSYLKENGRGPAPFESPQVTAFLTNFFDVQVWAPQNGGLVGSSAPGMYVFPMIPELTVSYTWLDDNGNPYQDPADVFRFDTKGVVPASYNNQIVTHFENMASEFLNDMEKEASGVANPQNPQWPNEDRALISWVFTDYFLLIARAVVQGARDMMKSFPHTIKVGESLKTIANLYGASVGSVEGSCGPLRLANTITLSSGGTTDTEENDSFAKIAMRFGLTDVARFIEDLANVNAFVPNLLVEGAPVICEDACYVVEENDTLYTLAKRIYPNGTPGHLALQIAHNTEILAADITLFVPVAMQRHVTRGLGERPMDIAAAFLPGGASEATVRAYVTEMGDLNACNRAFLRSGTSITRPAGGTYEIAIGDTLASIAGRPEINTTPGALLNTNWQNAQIVASGVTLLMPPRTITSGTNETHAAVAARFRVDPMELAVANREMVNMFADSQTVTVRDARSMTVEQLVTAMRTADKFLHAAGMSSRFMMPGLRLPEPQGFNNQAYLDPWEGNDEHPLYRVTRQQWELPDFPVFAANFNATYNQNLDKLELALYYDGDDEDLWFTFVDDNDNELDSVVLTFLWADFNWFTGLAGALLVPEITGLRKIPMFNIDPLRYPLTKPVELKPPTGVTIDMDGTAVSPSVPTMWSFAEGLRQVIAKPLGEQAAPVFGLRIIEPGEANQQYSSRAVGRSVWGTAIAVRIKRIAKPDGSFLPYTYELDGADPEGMILLEKILAANIESTIREVHLLYPTASTSDRPALATDGPEGVSAFIQRANLSTLSNPQGSRLEGLVGGLLNPIPNEFVTVPITMLERLMQGSIVRSGGYYLFYKHRTLTRGIPDTAFKDDGSALLTILITYKTLTGGLPRYVNRAVMLDDVASQSQVVAEGARALKQVTVNNTETIAGIMNKYRMSLNEIIYVMEGLTVLRKDAVLQLDGVVAGGGTHTILENQTLLDIANLRGASTADLAYRNANVAMFKDGSFNVMEGLYTKTPALPPAHTGFQIFRGIPSEDAMRMWPPANPQQEEEFYRTALEFLYNLFTFNVKEDGSFRVSKDAVPDGPGNSIVQLDGHPQPGESWKYEKIFPVAKFWNRVLQGVNGFPNPNKSPYVGIGEEITVEFGWLDGFGNITTTYFPYGAADPDDAAWKPFATNLLLGYTDEIIGVERWPGIVAGYYVCKNGNQKQLVVNFDFDVSRYTPRSIGQGNAGRVRDIARADREVLRKAYYQLTWGTTKLSLTTTLTGSNTDIDKTSVLAMLADAINYFDIIAVPTFEFRIATISAGFFDTWDTVATALQTTKDNLFRLNPDLPFIPVLANGQTVALYPVGATVTPPQKRNLSLNVDLPQDVIFPLTVSIGITRHDRIDDGFLDVPEVRQVVHEIEPVVRIEDIPAACAEQPSGENSPLRAFARAFEGAFTGTKIASGFSRVEDTGTDSRNRLWVVQESVVKHTIYTTDQHYFAPVPLAKHLLSGRGIPVRDYAPGIGPNTGLGTPTPKDFLNVDLDVWAKKFLNALDTVLLPQYAVPAYLLGQNTGPCQTNNCYGTLLRAKENIANAIVNTVEELQDAGGGYVNRARDLFRQRLLVRLSSAYETDAIVQIGVAPSSNFGANADTVPKLYGQVGGDRPQGATIAPEFTFSTARIPLIDFESDLTFFFSSEKAPTQSKLRVNARFNITALEREIEPGAGGFSLSSWLTFVIPPDPIDLPLEIPIPVRSYPTPPSLIEQTIRTAVHGEQPAGAKIPDTRGWEYAYTYERVTQAQDVLYTGFRFNVRRSDVISTPEDPDLFEALARFENAWPVLERELLDNLVKVGVNASAEEAERAEKALSAFVDLVKIVETAYPKWMGMRDQAYPPPGRTSDPYQFVLTEEDAGWFQITVRACGGQTDVAPPMVEIEGLDVAVTVVNPTTRSYRYYTTDLIGPMPVTWEAAQAYRRRRLVFSGIDILDKQNAWIGVYATRNENLFEDAACNPNAAKKVNEKFIYCTPTVRFTELLTPLVEYTGKIDVAEIDNTPDKTLSDHIVKLFDTYFKDVDLDPATRRLKVSCRYVYRLRTVTGCEDLEVTVPLMMTPTFEYDLTNDKGVANCNGNTGYVCALVTALEQWLTHRSPIRDNARFIFDMAVYSFIQEDDKLPVYRLSNVQLWMKNILNPPG